MLPLIVTRYLSYATRYTVTRGLVQLRKKYPPLLSFENAFSRSNLATHPTWGSSRCNYSFSTLNRWFDKSMIRKIENAWSFLDYSFQNFININNIRFVLLNFPRKFLMNIFAGRTCLSHFLFFFFFLFILAKVLATRGPGFVVRRWSKAPLFFLSLLFFSVHHDLTEKRVIFSLANKPRARFWQRNNCCQLGRDIVPPRCETAASFFQGILAYLYPSLPRIRAAT